jgi:amino acid permease
MSMIVSPETCWPRCSAAQSLAPALRPAEGSGLGLRQAQPGDENAQPVQIEDDHRAEDQPEHHRWRARLSWPHLVALGVGAIVGTGILTLIGVGADRAGPAVLLSFVVAGAICACAALCYAEMATMIPASGSAYTYSYATLGEIIAWVVGWSLILEYSLVVSTVAVGWSGYAVGFLKRGLGIALPDG